MISDYAKLDHWIDAHFAEETAFLQELVRVPTDTPPGDNAPHAVRTADLLAGFGFIADRYAVPEAIVREHGLASITNLVVRRRYGDGPTIALNAHGDVVPPGEGWSHDPYGGTIEAGRLYGRAAAVSKSDFATYTFAVRALESLALPLKGNVELHFTYDEEFGGELGPGWLLTMGLTKPDLLIAAGFSYQVITAHNGCLQLEVTVHGKMAHAAIPATGIDALQGANAILSALYAQNEIYRGVTSKVEGITHPYLNVGTIAGGTNTNVVPGKVVLKLDRRMIPEEDPVAVEATIRRVIAEAAAQVPGVTIEIKRLLLARALQPLPGNAPLVAALQRHGEAVFGEAIPVSGTPLYTDVGSMASRHPAAPAGPRTVLDRRQARQAPRPEDLPGDPGGGPDLLDLQASMPPLPRDARRRHAHRPSAGRCSPRSIAPRRSRAGRWTSGPIVRRLLVAPDHADRLVEQGNVDSVNHAEAVLAREAARRFAGRLWPAPGLTVEPAPCAGSTGRTSAGVSSASRRRCAPASGGTPRTRRSTCPAATCSPAARRT
jgi:acetylornithine deacetylase/succinyl-diaminopimelate desuccinylase-like protein